MKPAPAAIPKLFVRDPPPDRSESFAAALREFGPLGILLSTLGGDGDQARKGLASLLRSLIEEGQRFAQTPSGQHWARVLSDAPAVERGRLLWNQANIDYYLRNGSAGAEGPAALLEDALNHLASMDLATLSAQLSQIAVEVEAAAMSNNGTAR